MSLDWKSCSQARLTRDARYDGKFFIGVLTSGVYCRPICPARTAKESNCRYYPTAAAAAAAGFRPCLRCRPECSPGTPAWQGTSSTVSRALRLISEGALDDSTVDELATQLGVGERHLRRLFLQHLGATPIAVAHTRRLHFAKKLIDETTLPMNHIALLAGFGCVRRFNAVIRQTYRRTPTQIRRLSREAIEPAKNQYLFQLNFRPPYDWDGLLAYLAQRATPGVEEIQGRQYRRTIAVAGKHGFFQVSLIPGKDALSVHIQCTDPRSLLLIIEKIRAIFDLNADWQCICQTLTADPILAPELRINPGLRIPGCWDGFELAVRAILDQQNTFHSATVFAGKLVRVFGQHIPEHGPLNRLFPTPDALAGANLAAIGLPAGCAATIRALARAVCSGCLNFQRVADTDMLEKSLLQISGIEQWTAHYIAMRALRDPDAFPVSDVAVLRALRLKNFCELRRRSDSWRPWRAYAAMYLWSMTNRIRYPSPSFFTRLPDRERPVSDKQPVDSIEESA